VAVGRPRFQFLNHHLQNHKYFQFGVKTMPKHFLLSRPELEPAVATALRTCERAKDHQRLISMRLAASGKFTAAQIAKHVQVSRRQFFLWVAAFKKRGVYGLLERKHGGGLVLR
jgi:hypothetical protein